MMVVLASLCRVLLVSGRGMSYALVAYGCGIPHNVVV